MAQDIDLLKLSSPRIFLVRMLVFLILCALIVVVLAGLGSMLGTFVAGLFVGVAEAISAATFGGPYREVVGLVIFFVVLVLRPQGLFGPRAA